MANLALTQTSRPSPLKTWLANGMKNLRYDWPIHLILLTGLFISFIPIIFMLNISVKNQGQFMVNPMGVTAPFQWENYQIAYAVLARSIVNSVAYATIVTTVSLFISALSAYVFARYKFPGKELLFWFVLSVLFIPGILTFATRFVVIAELKLLNTYSGLILPWIAGAQIFQIFVLRTFFASISDELIEAARVDGAGIMTIFFRIIVPISRPIIATLAILRVIDTWEEWLWPLIVINQYEVRPMALQVFYLASDVGPHIGRQMAGYTIASIPLLILFIIFTRQFIDGLTSGAIKW